MVNFHQQLLGRPSSPRTKNKWFSNTMPTSTSHYHVGWITSISNFWEGPLHQNKTSGSATPCLNPIKIIMLGGWLPPATSLKDILTRKKIVQLHHTYIHFIYVTPCGWLPPETSSKTLFTQNQKQEVKQCHAYIYFTSSCQVVDLHQRLLGTTYSPRTKINFSANHAYIHCTFHHIWWLTSKSKI